MALYLNRREGVPGWEVGSSMLFIMFCEFFYLLTWALIGVAISWSIIPEIFHVIPYIGLGAALFWIVFRLVLPLGSLHWHQSAAAAAAQVIP